MQGLANMVWAFAAVKQLDEKLVTCLTGAVNWRATELNSQDLANIVWACSTVKKLNEQLFAELARAGE